MKSLDELRARLDDLDRELLQLVAERQVISGADRRGQARDRPAHARFPARTRGAAQGAPRRRSARRVAGARRVVAAGIDPRLAHDAGAGPRRVAGQGLRAARARDRRARQDGPLDRRFPRVAGLRDHDRRSLGRSARDTTTWPTGTRRTSTHDLIVVATPIRIANEVLGELAERKPRGVVFDIGSLKTPLRAGLETLRAAGCRVTSVHPMFGPDTELLSGRHVIFIDLGDASALHEARACSARRWPTSS